MFQKIVFKESQWEALLLKNKSWLKSIISLDQKWDLWNQVNHGHFACQHTSNNKFKKKMCVVWLYEKMTLCFCAAAVLLQCKLCHPSCCSLTQSLFLSLLWFHSHFSHSVCWDWADTVEPCEWHRSSGSSPLYSANQEMSSIIWKFSFFEYKAKHFTVTAAKHIRNGCQYIVWATNQTINASMNMQHF